MSLQSAVEVDIDMVLGSDNTFLVIYSEDTTGDGSSDNRIDITGWTVYFEFSDDKVNFTTYGGVVPAITYDQGEIFFTVISSAVHSMFLDNVRRWRIRLNSSGSDNVIVYGGVKFRS